MQWTPYAAMSDAIARYVSDQRDRGINATHIATAIEDALSAALGRHFIVDVSVAWRKGKENSSESD